MLTYYISSNLKHEFYVITLLRYNKVSFKHNKKQKWHCFATILEFSFERPISRHDFLTPAPTSFTATA